MRITIHVHLRPGVLDPQGAAIRQALTGLGFDGVQEVRQGKVFELDLAETDPRAARGKARAICDRLLANPVIEDYRISLPDMPDTPDTPDTPDG